MPIQARSRATIEAVLSAAAHILQSGGMAAFNTNAVAERAGVSIGSLYQYFPNKDAILVALIERRAHAFAETMEVLAADLAGISFTHDLHAFLSQAVAWHNEDARVSRILDAEEDRLASALDLQHVKGRLDATLMRMVDRHKDQFDGFDIPRLVGQIAAICKAVMEAEGCLAQPDWSLAVDRTVAAVRGYLSVPSRSAKVGGATDLGE